MEPPTAGLAALTLHGLRTCVADSADPARAGTATVPLRMRNVVRTTRLAPIFEKKFWAVAFRMAVTYLCRAIAGVRAGLDGDVDVADASSASDSSETSTTAGPVAELDMCLSAIGIQRGTYTKQHTLRTVEAVYDLPPGALCTPGARTRPMSVHNQSGYSLFESLGMGVREANAFLWGLVPAAHAPALQQLVMCELQSLYSKTRHAAYVPFYTSDAVHLAVDRWHNARGWDHWTRGVCASAVDVWTELKQIHRPRGSVLRQLDIVEFARVVAPCGLLSLKLPLVERAADVRALRQLRDAVAAMHPAPDAYHVAHCVLVGHLLWAPERVCEWRHFVLLPDGPFARLCRRQHENKKARRQRRRQKNHENKKARRQRRRQKNNQTSEPVAPAGAACRRPGQKMRRNTTSPPM